MRATVIDISETLNTDRVMREFDEVYRKKITPTLLDFLGSISDELRENRFQAKEVVMDGVMLNAIIMLLWNYNCEIIELRERVAMLEGGAA